MVTFYDENQFHINKSVHYIIQNMMLTLDLDKVAEVSGFSKFHFHRIFKEVTGETVGVFVRRIRLENAAYLLVFQRHRTILDIALSCGFSSSQSFATAFKKKYLMTPKKYQARNKGCQGISIVHKNSMEKYVVTLQFLDTFTVAYNSSFNNYSHSDIFKRRQEALKEFSPKTVVGIFWDNPEVTLQKHCRFDYGFIENDKSLTPPYMLKQDIEAKTYATITCNLEEAQSNEVWSYLYAHWLPHHGYIPDGIVCFEKISLVKKIKGLDLTEISFYVPIKKI